MKRALCCLVLVALGFVPARAQAPDVNKVLADARAALGGEKKLAGLKTLAATGQSVRVTDNASSAPTDMEFAFEVPDRFAQKDVVGSMPNGAVTHTSGFNGDQAINVIDRPPAMPGVIQIIKTTGPGGDGPLTPEQEAENRKNILLAAKQDYARLLLGITASSPGSYPLEFTYGGLAQSPDGKADIVDVKGEGGFAVRLFIDTATHLPLMLSWMAKEPLVIRVGPGAPAGPAGANVVQFSGHAQSPATPEDRDKMMKQAQEAAKAAQAKLRTVEYRLYYGDYRDVDGIKVPFKLQRSIDGKPTEEVTLDKVKVNGKIDPKRFEVK